MKDLKNLKQLKVFPSLNFAQYPELYLMVFLFFSCNKPYDGGFMPGPATCSKENTVAFPSDALDRLYFKDSTYWIYQDSISKETDSVWVTDSKMETSNKYMNIQLYKRCIESFYYTINSVNNGKTNINGYPNFIDDTTNIKNIYFRVDYTVKSSNPYTIFRFKVINNKYYTNQNGGLFDTIPTLIVNNISYTNIIHLKNPIANIDVYTEAYYAPSIGLIKYRSKAGRTWELIRYKINK